MTAGVLGITHGLEPDHLAGIISLTGSEGDSRSSALIGTIFALGHVLLVFVWLLGAFFLIENISLGESLTIIGPAITGVILIVLGVGLGVAGVRKLVHRHFHTHDGEKHEHYHLHIPLISRDSHDFTSRHSHEHAKREYLKIGLLGALFTLSPPLSMIAFISVTLPMVGGTIITVAVIIYSIAIISTMGLIGGGIGKLFNLVKTQNEQIHALSQCIASIMIIGFAGYLIGHNFLGLF
ncbi:hypothetical protein AKJ48_02465 [candidate division MSBL1 archaeon SCGC-AAA261O19]|nr:hypothetical protein AKJ48_02465 [candidate division MSBL1 archaeon SCGC-AAA261O19]